MTSRATIWRANQLRHRHHRMRPKGLEPLAHCLEGSCSIQLSYSTVRPARGYIKEPILLRLDKGTKNYLVAFPTHITYIPPANAISQE